MKNRVQFLIVVLSIITFFAKCESVYEKGHSILLKNNSTYSIGCYFAMGGNYGVFYPDTCLPKTDNYVIKEIEPQNYHSLDSSIPWEESLKSLNDTLSVFIFSTDTLNAYTWEEIRDGYKILIRYDFSLDELKKMKWEITYP